MASLLFDDDFTLGGESLLLSEPKKPKQPMPEVYEEGKSLLLSDPEKVEIFRPITDYAEIPIPGTPQFEQRAKATKKITGDIGEGFVNLWEGVESFAETAEAGRQYLEDLSSKYVVDPTYERAQKVAGLTVPAAELLLSPYTKEIQKTIDLGQTAGEELQKQVERNFQIAKLVTSAIVDEAFVYLDKKRINAKLKKYNKLFGELTEDERRELSRKDADFGYYSSIRFLAGERAVETYEEWIKANERFPKLETGKPIFEEGKELLFTEEPRPIEKMDITPVTDITLRSYSLLVDLIERPLRSFVLPEYRYSMAVLGAVVNGENLTEERLNELWWLSVYEMGGGIDEFTLPAETTVREEAAIQLGKIFNVEPEVIHQAFDEAKVFGISQIALLDTIISLSSATAEAGLAANFLRLSKTYKALRFLEMPGKVLEGATRAVYPTSVALGLGNAAVQNGLLGEELAEDWRKYLADNPESRQAINVATGISILGGLLKLGGKTIKQFQKLSIIDQHRLIQAELDRVNRDPKIINRVFKEFKKEYGINIKNLVRKELGEPGKLTLNDLNELNKIIDSFPKNIKNQFKGLEMELFNSPLSEGWVGGYTLKHYGLGLNIDTLRTKLMDVATGKITEAEAMETFRHELGHLFSRNLDPDLKTEFNKLTKNIKFGEGELYMYESEGEYFAELYRLYNSSPDTLYDLDPKGFNFISEVSKRINKGLMSPRDTIVKFTEETEGVMPRIHEVPEVLPKVLAEEAKKYKNVEEFIKSQKPSTSKISLDTTQIKIKDLYSHGEPELRMAIYDVEAGALSKTTEPIEVTQLPNGKIVVIDGLHRAVQAMEQGENTLNVKVIPYEDVMNPDFPYGNIRGLLEGYFEGPPLRSESKLINIYNKAKRSVIEAKPKPELMPRMTTEEVAQKAYLDTLKEGGVTIKTTSGTIPKKGYSYSPHKDVELVIKTEELTQDTIKGYIEKNTDLLKKKGKYLGLWIDEKNGKIYMDVTEVKLDKATALEDAGKNKQLAIYDLENGKEIYTKYGKAQDKALDIRSKGAEPRGDISGVAKGIERKGPEYFPRVIDERKAFGPLGSMFGEQRKPKMWGGAELEAINRAAEYTGKAKDLTGKIRLEIDDWNDKEMKILDGEMRVGMIRVEPTGEGEVEVTWLEVGKQFRRKGIATEANRLLFEQLSEDPDIKTIIAKPIVPESFKSLLSSVGEPSRVWETGYGYDLTIEEALEKIEIGRGGVSIVMEYNVEDLTFVPVKVKPEFMPRVTSLKDFQDVKKVPPELYGGEKAVGFQDIPDAKKVEINKQIRFKIDDQKTKLKYTGKQMARSDTELWHLDEIMEHEELYKRYPFAKDIRVVMDPNLKEGIIARTGQIDEDFAIYYNPKEIEKMTKGEFTASLLHEVQHAIQNYEGITLVGKKGLEKEAMAVEGEYMFRKGYTAGGFKELDIKPVEWMPRMITDRKMTMRGFDLNKSEIANLKKLQTLAGLDQKDVQSWDDLRVLAQRYGENPLKLIKESDLDNMSADQVFAIKQYVATEQKKLSALLKQRGTGIVKDLPKLNEEIVKTNNNITNALKKLRIGNTENARALNATKMQTTSSMDPVMWLYKAEKMNKEPLKVEQRGAILDFIKNKDPMGLAAYMQTFGSPDLADKGITLWKAGLLSSPSTHIRNIFSTYTMNMLEMAKDIPAAALDKLIARSTGERTVTFGSIGQYFKGWRKAVADAHDVAKYGFSEADMGKTEMYRKVIFKSETANKATNLIFRSMAAEDKIFRTMFEQYSLYKQCKIQAINEGLSGESLKARTLELLVNPTEEMLKIADSEGRKASFNDDNSIATFLMKGKPGLTRAPVTKVGIELTMPFKRTPLNVAKSIAEYSPAQLVILPIQAGKKFNAEGWNAEIQKMIAEGVGRAVIGTSIMWKGYEMAQNGQMTGLYPTADQDQKEWRAKGYYAGDMIIGGNAYNTKNISPLANLLQMGAMIYEMQQNEPEAWDLIKKSAMGGVSTVTEQTFLLGVSRTTKALAEPERFSESWFENLIGGMVPTIIRQLADASDTYNREINGGLDRLKYGVPGLRQTLLPKLDQFGEPIPTNASARLGDTDGFMLRAITRLFDPFNSRPVNESIMIDEYTRLKEAGYRGYPSSPGRSRTYRKKVTVNDKKYEINEKIVMDDVTYNTFRQYQGQLMAMAHEEVIQMPEYQAMDDETKDKILDSIYTKSTDVVMEAMLPVFIESDPKFKEGILADVAEIEKEIGSDIELQYNELPEFYKIDIEGIIQKYQ